MAKQIKKHGKLALVFGLILILTAMYLAIPRIQAAAIYDQSILISDSRPTQTGVTYTFTGTHSSTSVKCIRVQYCTNASGACTKPTAMVTTSATKGTFTGWTTGSWTIDNTTDGETKYTNAAGEAGGAGYVVQTGTITNSSTAATAFARVTTYTDTGCSTPAGGQDTGTAAFAIISGVTVSATVAETLTFSVNAVTAANCPNYDDGVAPNEVDTTATTVPFSTVTVETFYDACQDLRVATNAANGYNTTIQETDQLTSGGADQIADGTCDGACTDSAEADWATATFNGFGYCMDDQGGYGDGSATADAGWGTNGCDDIDTFFKTIADAGAAETAQAIMSSTALVSDDRSFVGFRLSVDTAQAAGTYTNTIVYITTPLY